MTSYVLIYRCQQDKADTEKARKDPERGGKEGKDEKNL